MKLEIMCEKGDAYELCKNWASPIVIVSDGPYGVSGYDGDLNNHTKLSDWYDKHIQIWSEHSTPLTTLWFWNTEIGWAVTHSILEKYGWIYRSCNIWDKGIAHIAGNCNTKTLRRFPVVTEVCVQYVRKAQFQLSQNKSISTQDWLRSEWKRSGLPLNSANAACGVVNAATRKYLTSDHCWYMPTPEVFEKLVSHANEHGLEDGKPYFAIDGRVLTRNTWDQLRGKFHCPSGVTNVWQYPALRGRERIKIDGACAHTNQKPLELMRRIIEVSSDEGDVVWEPFGGLCSASIMAKQLNRQAYCAEINHATYELAIKRIEVNG